MGSRGTEVSWPRICSGCGSQNADLGEPFEHTFEHVKSSGSKYAGGKTTTTTTLGAVLYVCSDCRKAAEDYAATLEKAIDAHLPGVGYLGLAVSFVILWVSLEIDRMQPSQRLILFLPLSAGLTVLVFGCIVGSYIFMRALMIDGASSLARETRMQPFTHYVSFDDGVPNFRSLTFQAIYSRLNPAMISRLRPPSTPLSQTGKLKMSIDNILIGLVIGYGLPFGLIYAIHYLTSIGVLA